MAGKWSLQKVENGDIYVLIAGQKAKNQHLEDYEKVVCVQPGDHRDQLRFKFANSNHGKKLDRTKIDITDEFNKGLAQCASNAEYIALLTKTSTVSRKRNIPSTSSAQSSNNSRRPRFSDVQEQTVPSVAISSSSLSDFYAEDQEILGRRVGRFQMSVSRLERPPSKYLCRPISEWWVKKIKENLSVTRSPNVTVLPCLVDTEQLNNSDEFREESMDSYRVFTLGGNHFRAAVHELLQEKDHEDTQVFNLVQVDLYVGLSTQQARRLGNLHNRQTETSRLTFLDEVRQVRRILFEMTGRDMNTDEPDRDVPNGYKKQCYLQLSLHNSSNDPLTTTFHVAQYSKRCWETLETLAEKELTLNAGKETCLKRSTFRNFQGVCEADIFGLLTPVADGTTSLASAAAKAKSSKTMNVIKNSFLNLTGTTSWEAATQRYPEATSEETLQLFLPKFPTSLSNLDLQQNRLTIGSPIPDRLRSRKKWIPQEFIAFCRRAAFVRKDLWKVSTKVYFQGRACPNPEVMKVVERHEQKLMEELQKLDISPDLNESLSDMDDGDDDLLASLC